MGPGFQFMMGNTIQGDELSLKVMPPWVCVSIVFGVVLVGQKSVNGGCWQRRLCCPGRNTSCKALDDGIGHLPLHGLASAHHNHFQRLSQKFGMSKPNERERAPPVPHYSNDRDDVRLVYPNVYDALNNEKLGHLVMPDVVALKDSGAELLYNKYGLKADQNGALSTTTTPAPDPSAIKMWKHLLFGREQGPDEEPLERVHFAEMPKNLLVRYSVLQHHIPLTIATLTDLEDEPQQLMYLEAPEIECYCDEECVKLGDCCSDYTYVCPPQDCLVDPWNPWEPCIPDHGFCGIGMQRRERRIRAAPERGGAECPALLEMRTCWKNCRSSEQAKKSVKLKTTHYYCIEYELGWVNKNCVNKAITKHLHRGNRICAECQPHARQHRKTDRCASDLDDGESGFWKLIGPKSCNGIWTRVERKNHCRCSRDWPHLDPFLLV
ncbi:unnamed protein product, partial [Mesorhabditis belari]|uniref:SMB domain-containing protein n=1 Tax=Mesorhabditis belari TaxID=2138241 RepID=A0AAF3E8H6_9BILA